MYQLLIILMCSLGISVTVFAQQASDNTITLKVPPKVLAKWYKPANKRQVWLHTMFRLRREMLAISLYTEKRQQAELEKWFEKFSKDYQSIATMVPQWQDYLYLDKLKQLETSVQNRDYSSVLTILKKMGKSCMHCHDDFQTVTTLLYRGNDFTEQNITISHTNQIIAYDDMMSQLSNSVNRINIAIKDGFFDDAQKNTIKLKNQLDDLSNNCSSECHKKDDVPVERIIGASHTLLPELEAQLKMKNKKQAGRKLGEFAVKVCARCHSIHRLTSDLKNQFE